MNIEEPRHIVNLMTKAKEDAVFLEQRGGCEYGHLTRERIKFLELSLERLENMIIEIGCDIKSMKNRENVKTIILIVIAFFSGSIAWENLLKIFLK